MTRTEQSCAELLVYQFNHIYFKDCSNSASAYAVNLSGLLTLGGETVREEIRAFLKKE